MKSRSLSAQRHVLTSVAAAALWLMAAPHASALGLGRLNVQSSLGESLRAEIDVTSLTPEEATNLRIRVAPPEAYRAAGVDYNAVLSGTRASLQRRPDGRVFLRMTSDRAVQEPFVDVILEATWNTGRLVREYTLLLDPPSQRPPAAPATQAGGSTPEPLQSASPVFSAAQPEAAVPSRLPERRLSPARPPLASTAPPVAAASSPPAAAPARPPREAPAARQADVADAAPRRGGVGAPAAAAAASGGGEYQVRLGDTLTRVAGRTQHRGVSLDQMLTALYRNNPQAFIGGNIDRLRAGAVLAVPSAEQAAALASGGPRPTLRAQSADFDAYRDKLGRAAPSVPAEGSPRQAGGRVQGAVDDRRQAAVGSDRLTLSPPGAPVSPADQLLAKEREAQEAATRAAELRRNVDELRRLADAAAASRGAAAAAAPASAPIAARMPVAASPAVPASAVAAVPSTTPPATATAPAPAAAPAPPTVTAQAPAAGPAANPAPKSATASAASPGPGGAGTPTTVAAASPPASGPGMALPAVSAASTATPRPTPATPAAVEDDSFLGDNLPLFGLGALLVALVGGLAYYRLRRRDRADSSESSYLESRLTPDSFFGASGGQRIDTRESGAPSSSMSYSLSQLDAIGDVDAVAEADVYLAYGRDLQAEEILKEAMRASPERLAIRVKLLEVYAKRRDGKGFELLATQLYGLTGGQGEDWARAQALGVQIDPENPLYRPGGRPPVGETGSDAGYATEPLGASTMPQSVMPQQIGSPAPLPAPAAGAGFLPVEPVPGYPSSAVDLELDLDLDMPVPPQDQALPEMAQLAAAYDASAPVTTTDFDLPFDTLPEPAPSAPGGAAATAPPPSLDLASSSSSNLMDFDLSDLPLDFDLPSPDDSRPPAAPELPTPISDFGSLDFGGDFSTADSATPAATTATAAAGDDEGDPYERKIELADEFRQIGDADGARDLLLEVVARASGAQKARAQSMLDALS